MHDPVPPNLQAGIRQAFLLGLARLVIVSAAATTIVEAAGKLGDTFSSDLLSKAHLGSSGWSGVIAFGVSKLSRYRPRKISAEIIN